jgi:hypothetical protein
VPEGVRRPRHGAEQRAPRRFDQLEYLSEERVHLTYELPLPRSCSTTTTS